MLKVSDKLGAHQSANEDLDVLIVGAGISGIGSAYHLKDQCPEKSFLILDAQDDFGGTWKTHDYPGIRSDTDLYTYSYRFKPWEKSPIATREQIRNYLTEVMADKAIDKHIRYNTKVIRCSWSGKDGKWTVETARTDGSLGTTYRCAFLWMCQGYYDHDNPHLPDWAGLQNFRGTFFHAQKWQADVDYKGKQVVVIGSGATAATLIPSMADDAAHTTMLQRSPTYFLCYPNRSALADRLRKVGVDEMTIHHCVRLDYLHQHKELDRRSKEEPEVIAEELKSLIRLYAGEDFEFEPHFIPTYRPWQQRIAFMPEGELFAKIKEGKVSVVTDKIDHFTADGIHLASGADIKADIVVAATGFNLLVMGGIEFVVDGRTIDWSTSPTYRGMMFPGVPNMLWVFGYFRAAWTLRVDLLGDFVCRLLRHMDAKGARVVEIMLPEGSSDEPLKPWMPDDDFNPGYLTREIDKLPKRLGDWAEATEIPAIDLDGSAFSYR